MFGAKPEPGVGSGDLIPGPVHTWAAGVHKSAKARADLAAVDKLYAADVKKRGADALDSWGTADVRLNIEEHFPSADRASAKAMRKTTADLVRILPKGSGCR